MTLAVGIDVLKEIHWATVRQAGFQCSTLRRREAVERALLEHACLHSARTQREHVHRLMHQLCRDVPGEVRQRSLAHPVRDLERGKLRHAAADAVHPKK